MKCVFCRGTLQQEIVTLTYEDEEKFILVEHVSAEVCSQCGEKPYAPDVTEALLRFAKHPMKPIKMKQVPVYDFQEISFSA